MQIKFKNAIRRINIMAMLVVSRDARMFNVCKSRDVMQTQGLKLHHFSQCRKTFQQTLASGYSLPKARTSVCICMPGLPLLFTMFSQPPEAFSWFSSVHFAWLFLLLCTGLLNFHTGLISFLSTFPQPFSRT